MISAAPRLERFPASVVRALSCLDSPATDTWLSRFLDATVNSVWPDVAWGSSLLTPGGFPLELSFSTNDPTVARYAVEIAGPETPSRDRLGHALRLLRQWEIPRPASPVLPMLQEAHAASPVRWGCWLGGRHRPAGDQFKLYVEVPPRLAGTVAERCGGLLGRRPRLLDQLGELRLVGLHAGSSDVELYYRLGRVERSSAEAFFKAEGLGDGAAGVLGLLERTVGREAPVDLPGANLCASVTISADGPKSVSLIAHCVGLLGLDAACRQRVLNLAADLGLVLGSYEQLSRPLEGTPAAERHHTTIAFSSGLDGPPHLAIGLRPPVN